MNRVGGSVVSLDMNEEMVERASEEAAIEAGFIPLTPPRASR